MRARIARSEQPVDLTREQRSKLSCARSAGTKMAEKLDPGRRSGQAGPGEPVPGAGRRDHREEVEGLLGDRPQRFWRSADSAARADSGVPGKDRKCAGRFQRRRQQDRNAHWLAGQPESAIGGRGAQPFHRIARLIEDSRRLGRIHPARSAGEGRPARRRSVYAAAIVPRRRDGRRR